MRPRLAYWMHQLVEYLLGLVLLSEAARMHRPLWPAVGGVALVLAGALGDAPLSAFRTVPRRVHRIVDVMVGLALVALGALVVDGGAGVFMAVVGVLVLVVAAITDFRARVAKPPLRERLPDAHMVGRIAGRMTGRAVVAGRSRWRTKR